MITADVLFNAHVPMRKRLMFFAKIDADDVADRLQIGSPPRW